ncbi:hypothetical protein [Phenylobacterium sp.]|uniref:hypothetical protein n=1 Tax=Phenylobacterium sp. TaxID=1871053 RepID=UPI003564FC17
MQRVRVLLGLLAAIILMVGGAPASATSNPCNPCPPDCPMMAQMAQAGAMADHQDQAPGKSGRAETPCKSTAVCQTAFAVPLLPQTAVETVLLAETTAHDLVGALAAPSRPPDPTLRPPIQL